MMTDPTSSSTALAAHAKLNVSLRVLGREESGYHTIETVLLRLELADRLEIEIDAGGEPAVRLRVTGDPSVPSGASNLCWQAADGLSRAVAYAGEVRIHLEKRIPTGAGLGGGSADAAVVLRALDQMLGNPLDEAALMGLAGEIGSDVPFGLCESPMALAWGRGTRLFPLDAPAPRPVLIVVPDYPIGAGEAYAWLAEDRAAGISAPPGPGLLPRLAGLSDTATLDGMAANDLAGPVFRRHPDLAEIRDTLTDGGADVAILCGSGSCVAGLFSDESTLARAAESFRVVDGLSTIRTRTLGAPAASG